MTYTICKVKHLADQADGNLFEVSLQLSGSFVAYVASPGDLRTMAKNIQEALDGYDAKIAKEVGENFTEVMDDLAEDKQLQTIKNLL